MPPCADRITVSGQHARASQSTLILDHTYDLPFTQTAITIEDPEGRTQEIVVTNSVPDVWRLIGAGFLGATGGVLLARYSLDVMEGGDSLRGGWFWALPVGLVATGMAAGMALTGWHPTGDTVIDYPCQAP